MRGRNQAAAVSDRADLGVDWKRYSDGRAWRLRRKKDFPNVDPGLARDAAEVAAKQMGKVVRSVRDKMLPNKAIWVQFADAEVRIGEPCPRCGSRRLLRLHPHFARCAECKVQLMLSRSALDDDEGDGSMDRMATRLRDLSEVRLTWFERLEDLESYRGYGEAEGVPSLLLVRFRLADGEHLTPENAYDRVEKVKAMPLVMFEGLFDAESLQRQDGPGPHLTL